MPFLALHFEAEAEIAERLADALIAAGALSVDVADALAGSPTEMALYDESGGSPLWSVNRFTVLFPEGCDTERALAEAAAALDIASLPHVVETVADRDWVRSTQHQFRPLQVGEGLWIVPTWCEPVQPQAINVRIDPGLAFGTGSHATTRLCIRWLACNLRPGATLLDYGCGSGVLAIVAAKLGARDVVGIDIDAEAIATSRANAQANDVSVSFHLPEELPAQLFDVVVANILAGPIELLAPLLASHVREGGNVILCGILESQAGAVLAAYGRWFNISVWEREGEWAALVGTRVT
jgi:ribosomal protein L11 methyltransferase